MNDQKQQIVAQLKEANNVLVTVSNSPTLDQLAACIGLTLILSRMDKHATAVFSGEIPSAIEFLKPDKTIEKSTDSLRDFIISLDKSKADKLRYKVEDEVVKIFITPYRQSISEKDLIFSQGDLNVDVVVGLGIHRQQDLDDAITSHGRILHDATVICINNTPVTELGSINWLDLSASSLSELVAALAIDLGDDVLNEQSATALLTGVVSETNHFGNIHTTPQTLTVSAKLLEAGADQQLVADKIQPVIAPVNAQDALQAQQKKEDGSLEVVHDGEERSGTPINPESPSLSLQTAEPNQPMPAGLEALSSLMGEENGGSGESTQTSDADSRKAQAAPAGGDQNQTEPQPSGESKSNDPMVTGIFPQPLNGPLHPLKISADSSAPVPDSLAQTTPAQMPQQPVAAQMPQTMPVPDQQPGPGPQFQAAPDTLSAMPPGTPTPAVDTNKTLAEIEVAVNSPHLKEEGVDSARQAVESALDQKGDESPLEPLQALNAQPVNLDLGHGNPAPQPSPIENSAPPQHHDNGLIQADPFVVKPSDPPNPAINEPAPLSMSPPDQPFTMPIPSSFNPQPAPPSPPQVANMPNQGPPPPPSMPPPGFGS